MNLFRPRRTASPSQRIMLIARDGGCTKPCCTVGAYGSQVHHALRDWADGGQTNANELALACGPDNRLAGSDGGWTTTINARGEVEWIPPPQLDTGQGRLNHYHRPEALLRPPQGDPQTCAPSPAIATTDPPLSEPDPNAGADHEYLRPTPLTGNDQTDGGNKVRGP